ncbi:MAG: redox-regulated ATPase YchF, partial [Candidatus Shapirobacteria bacterium]|jgi:hypothetical protein
LAKIVNTAKIVPAAVEFVDIAGLVKGASQGAGLGNQFLTNIRECQAICHVVRAFTDPSVVKEGSTDPQADFEVICAELIIKDLETVDKYLDSAKNNAKEKITPKFFLAQKLKAELEKGILALNIKKTDEEQELLKEFFLLTAKPYFIVANVDEDTYQNISDFHLQVTNFETVIPVCAKIEFELSELSQGDQLNYLKDLGMDQPGLVRVIQKAYEVLGLQSFYTAGVKEARAWTIKQGTKAAQAAGVIHTDFIKGFIMADIVSFADFNMHQGWQGAKNAGCLRHEGREYVMHPDDVVEFKVNT